jgi:glycosyltransferase involved in cell wall biosynthesis
MTNDQGHAVHLSVVIITLNEERNIRRCLDAARQVADEIVVLDSGSSDATRSICSEFDVKFYEQAFRGYDLQKNDAVHLAVHDHILSLDADEVLSAELVESILEIKKNWAYTAYAFNRITAFCGKWVKHGEWYPDKVIRLFDRREVRWSGVLHEKLQFNGRPSVGFLKGRLLHYSYYSLPDFRHKSRQYAETAAAQLYEKGRWPWLYHLYFKPAYRFFHAYILRKGFLDGYAGYQIACLTAQRLFLKFLKVRMMHEKDRRR